MAYHFEFDRDHRVLLVVLEDDVQDQEMLEIEAEIKIHIENLKPTSGITDASTVTTFNVSSHTIRTLARRPSPYSQGNRSFLVAPTDYLFGMARMYQISGDREGMQVVRSREEALAALGVQNPRFERLAQTDLDRPE